MSCLRATLDSQFSDALVGSDREIAWILEYKPTHIPCLHVEHALQFGDAMRAWVVLILGLTGCVFDEHGKSPCAGERTFDVATPADDAPMQFQIDRCRVDVDACTDLCALALERNQIPGVQTHCHVAFSADIAQIDVTYGCSVPSGGIGEGDGSGSGGVK